MLKDIASLPYMVILSLIGQIWITTCTIDNDLSNVWNFRMDSARKFEASRLEDNRYETTGEMAGFSNRSKLPENIGS